MKTIVKLKDEHGQLIDVRQDNRGWWWRFPDFKAHSFPKSGPFKTREAAINDAQDYVTQLP